MGIRGVYLDKINLDVDKSFYKNDPETIIYVRLLAWRNKFENARCLKKDRKSINDNACSVVLKIMIGLVLARRWEKKTETICTDKVEGLQK